MSTTDHGIEGGRELDDLLRTLPEKMQKNVNRAGLRAGAVVLLDQVKQNIPVKSGNLRKTARISSRAKNGAVSVSVKAGGKVKGIDAWYARLVEFGTRPHLVQVSEKDRGINGRTGRAVSVTTVNRRRSLMIGTTLVGPSVQHPGSRARPFMRPAIDAKLPEALKAITAKIRERLSKQGLNTPAPIPVDPEE